MLTAYQEYIRTMLELLRLRIEQPLSQQVEARFAAELDVYWRHMSEDERARIECLYSRKVAEAAIETWRSVVYELQEHE